MTSNPVATPLSPDRADAAAREQVVLCAPDGTAVGTADKVDVHGPDTPLHLAFSCYVFDSAGELLVTRRAYDKRTFPGLRTNSCCGHPAPAEPIDTAVRRRVQDELGVELDDITLVLPRFRYRAVATDGIVENELCPVFRAVARDRRLRPDPVEVAAAWWVPWADFARTADEAHDDPLSAWGREQVTELTQLGPEPMRWPAAPAGDLPSAATLQQPAAASADGHPRTQLSAP